MKTLLTVILNWRTADMTLSAAEVALREMKGIPGALTIVDNDSGDGSYEKLSAAVAERGWDKGEIPVRVIQSGHNGGFGAGNNVGIRAGLPGGDRPDYVYILNSDAFPSVGAIRALYNHLEDNPKTGFTGSYVHGEDGTPHRAAFRFPSIAGEFESSVRFGPVSRLLHRYIVAQPIPETTTRVDWLVGASLMMRQSVLDEVGLFDETFFLYFEETELSHRAAAAGYPSDFVRTSTVMHIGSVSTGMKTWARMPSYWFDSRLYYFTKVHGRGYAALATLSLVFGSILWRLRLLFQRKERADPPHFLRDLIAHTARSIFRHRA
ncbi:glycosyltransferase family 2 protein [Pseudorhodobacter turbinis]|uniref:Glycosyltransferase family 2 protein n=1 Tax=Pseudorhodobacter turbinis TaxID=2500533 RepID=A0A4P8EH76_9RHOB|nr:glycosyltransferase family 2 protein [Pseudorhodobacter turbinis]QCO56122.1 glycosyltransferase family 2 protein [Pseudorhodobacter turbinis]